MSGGIKHIKLSVDDKCVPETIEILERVSPGKKPHEMYVLEGIDKQAYCFLFNGYNGSGNGSKYHASAPGHGIFACEEDGSIKHWHFPIFDGDDYKLRQLADMPPSFDAGIIADAYINEMAENARKRGDPFQYDV